MNAKARTFRAGAGGEIGKLLESANELRPAIWIAAVIHRVDADENIRRSEHFCPGQSVGKKDRVPRRDVGDRNAASRVGDSRSSVALFRNVDISSQRRTSEKAEIDLRNAMFLRA